MSFGAVCFEAALVLCRCDWEHLCRGNRTDLSRQDTVAAIDGEETPSLPHSGSVLQGNYCPGRPLPATVSVYHMDYLCIKVLYIHKDPQNLLLDTDTWCFLPPEYRITRILQ